MTNRRHNREVGPRRGRRGFTLLEALLASAILAMVVSAMVMPFAAGAQNDRASACQALAVTLAQDLMEEVLSRPLDDPDGAARTPGPDVGETIGNRATFDNVDDYDGYVEPAGTVRPVQQTKAADPLAAMLSRSVKVQYVRLSGQSALTPMNVCRVTVQVNKGQEELTKLTRLVYAGQQGKE
jgi:prepilin-type N-terminal cleavage/methylation domain-containing protein